MAGKTIRQQTLRVSVARSNHAHIAGFTPMNGWARFYNPDDAVSFVQTKEMADITCSIYTQCNQTAVDWTTRNRYNGNANVADRTD